MPLRVKIKKSLGGRAERGPRPFVLDAEFEAEDEVVGLLGASGCGKSMTLNCIAGIVRPDEGKIVVNGVTFFDSEKKIDLPPQKRRAGLLFQNCALFPNMTVEQNIMCVLSLAKNRSGGRLSSLLKKFYLNGLEHHYPAQLSGGQKQRAALARIMAGEPSILMLDEPFSALDSYLRWKLEEELLQVIEEFEGPVLYVSHNRDEVYRLCGRVCVMDSGRSEKIRTVRELFEFPDTFASALLSGCKNYSRAEKVDAGTVRALDWGINLACGAELSGEIRYIGVRARHVKITKLTQLTKNMEKTGTNVFPCRVARVTEDVSSAFANLEPLNLPEEVLSDFSRIRAEITEPREVPEAGDVVLAKIEPLNIMLLNK